MAGKGLLQVSTPDTAPVYYREGFAAAKIRGVIVRAASDLIAYRPSESSNASLELHNCLSRALLEIELKIFICGYGALLGKSA